MFQNRLKLFLLILLAVSGLMVVRALQLQVVERGEWAGRAARAFAVPAQLTETTRGRILDYKGREVAVDSPCVDLCVDYRAIVAPGPGEILALDTDDTKQEYRWLKNVALRRMGAEYAEGNAAAKRQMLADEIVRVRGDIRAMWGIIANRAGRGVEEIEETRRGIVQRVEMRRRYVWFHHWNSAVARQKALPDEPWYRRWLVGEGQDQIAVDSFDLAVDEQRDAHVILADVGPEVANYFGKDPERFPGLSLRPGIKRVYPYGTAGCHLIGHLSRVNREDLLADDNEDELRKYWPNDLVGRTGVEALAEPLLRGSRGRVVKEGDKEPAAEAIGGKDVRLSIDIELQHDIQELFKHVAISEGTGEEKRIAFHTMHGAAVVIDVPTGEVRALASYPDYDLNRLDEDYNKLAADTLDAPLLNRATQVAREPGSTAKPMIGLGAIAAGLISPTDTVECRGFLYIDGKKQGTGRCWVASRYMKSLGEAGVMHHQVPGYDPHPTGFLTFADALERSCNVYFETLGDRLKIEGEGRVFRSFGLGRHTGIGIAESVGKVPTDYVTPPGARRSTAWYSAIGQLRVLATPIQMAGAAATIARDGVWMKPKLLVTGTPLVTKPSTQPSEKDAPEEDSIDLHLPAAGVRAAKLGMYKVVYEPAGTGRLVAHKDDDNPGATLSKDRYLEPALAHLKIAGKTGTAQASRIRVPVLDGAGKAVVDEKGKEEMEFLRPAVPGEAHPQYEWYRATNAEGDNFNHAWFIGFVPADKPMVAFAVMVEYGENGGGVAGRVAKRVVEACVQHGYLPASGQKSNEVARGE